MSERIEQEDIMHIDVWDDELGKDWHTLVTYKFCDGTYSVCSCWGSFREGEE